MTGETVAMPGGRLVALFDLWTVGHALWGVFFAWRRATFWMVVALAFAWEWFENTVLQPVGWGEPGNPMNSLVDVAVAVAVCGAIVLVRDRTLDRWDDQ